MSRRFTQMNADQIIGVVGAGTMGNGIAQVSARAGYDLIRHDVREEFLDRGLRAIDKSLQRDVDKERLDAQGKQSITARVKTTTASASFKDPELAVEAVTEDPGVKPQVLKTLDQVTPPHAILASNTSSISITKLA